MRIVVALAALSLGAAGPVAGAPAPGIPPEVHLVPHRAVYELSLARAGGARAIEAARGRIVFEFTGDACRGFDLQYRQVTVLESGETGARTSDLRNTTHEGGDGRDFRFRTQSVLDGAAGEAVAGRAERSGDALRIALSPPQRASLTAEGDIVFPSAHMARLIAAARAGERTASIRVFDGSDDGRKVYDTLAVIGAPRGPGEADAADAPMRGGALRTMTRWPVTLSYFAAGKGDGRPVYTLGFDLYENGVSGALRLDYGDFALKGEASRLDLLPENRDCRR